MIEISSLLSLSPDMSGWSLIKTGNTVTAAHVNHIVNGLEHCTLPKREWTHGAHLCAGTALLRQAEHIMPAIIRRYNRACGVPNSDTEGYHHTITLFYLRTLNQALQNRWSEDLGVLANHILTSEISDKAYPLRFYSPSHLFSVTARHKWVNADLV